MFDMKKMKLTGSREKIIASVAIIVLALVIFTKFIYLPQKPDVTVYRTGEKSGTKRADCDQ